MRKSADEGYAHWFDERCGLRLPTYAAVLDSFRIIQRAHPTARRYVAASPGAAVKPMRCR